MPTTVFQVSGIGGNYTISRDSVGYVWTFPIVSGSVIPTSGVAVTSASFNFTNITTLSSVRQARIDKENVGMVAGPFAVSSGLDSSPFTVGCTTDISYYAGISSIQLRVRGNGTGGTTGSCFSIRSACVMTLTVNWDYTTSSWVNVGGTWRKAIPWINIGGAWYKAIMWENIGGTVSGLSVEVGSGTAFINGRIAVIKTAKTLTLDASTTNRMDRIILRLDVQNRTLTLEVLKGTSATAPTLTQTENTYEISLAKVLVPANSVETVLTDEREYAYNPTQAMVKMNAITSGAEYVYAVYA